jgi:uncharacterized membrane protein YbhN (UPF0104 family)
VWIKIAGTALSLGLLAWLLARQGWAQLGAACTGLEAWRLGALLLLTLVSRLAIAGRWHLLLWACGAPLPWRQSVALTFTGLFASNFLPSTVGGDVVRLAGAMQQGCAGADATASLLLDRVTGAVGMACALPFALPAAHLASAVLVLPARVTCAVRRTGVALAQGGRRPWRLLAALLLTYVHMACMFGFITLVFRGFGQHIPLPLLAGLWVCIYFVTLLPISLNGLGVQELSIVYAYTHFGGVSPTAALALSLLMRAIMAAASLPGAVFLPGVLAGRSNAQ